MKSSFTIILSLLTSVCFCQTEVSINNKFDWLVGTWNQPNISKPGRVSYEVWQKFSDQKLTGYGITLQDQDTVFIERFSILIKDNIIYYVADVPENKEPVYFRMTEITDSGFSCENLNHDFPKKITYKLDGVNLKAQISGNGKFIEYLFKRQ